MTQVFFHLEIKEQKYYPSWSHLAMQQLEPYISKLCWKYHIKNIDPDDLAQELRIRVWSQLPKYDPAKASFKAWAYTVMRNHLYNLWWKTMMKKGRNLLDTEGRLEFNLDDDEYDIMTANDPANKTFHTLY